MDGIEKLLQAIAALLWPLIALFLIVLFRPAVSAIIESAKSRRFTLKIGGQELTMEEANANQRGLIADLQNQVLEIRETLGNKSESQELIAAPHAALTASPDDKPSKASLVLWVDDNPKNNSYFVEQLRNSGTRVDLATSTADGVKLLASTKYSYIISDMGRKEDSHYNHVAGIDLLQIAREKDPSIPFVIYCSSQARRTYGQRALELGATAITSSPTDLFGILNLYVGNVQS